MGNILIIKTKASAKKKKERFKQYIRVKYGFFAFIIQILYDIELHRQYPNFYPLEVPVVRFVQRFLPSQAEVSKSSKGGFEVSESSSSSSKGALSKKNPYLDS